VSSDFIGGGETLFNCKAEKGSFRNSCNLERSGLKMGSCRYVYNCGCCVELQCLLLVDRDAAGQEVELIEPIDELCYIFAGWK
jgi:hypothetical protein